MTESFRRKRKRLKRWVVFQLARLSIATIALLPESLALAVGRGIGAVAYFLARSVRARAIEQLVAALGIPPEEARRTARAMFRHLGLTIAELVLLSRNVRLLERWVPLEQGQVQLLRSCLDRGRGVIAVSAHLGNWELLPQRFAIEGLPVLTAARENPNPYLDRWVVGLRDRGQVRTLHRGSAAAAKEMLRALRKGAIFALLIDQDTKVRSTFVPFFGRPASTPIGPAELAIRAGVPVVASFIVREGDRHRVHLEEVRYDDLAGELDERAIALTARLTAIIERQIRETPEQWVWFHRRWKRQPPVEP